MKSQHKTEKEVIEAMKLPKKEQANAFADLRKKGIYLENMKQIRNGSKTNLIRERQQGNDDIVSCSVCKAFLSKTSFYKHKKICQTADKETISSAINVTVLQENKGGKYVEYTAQVLSRFRDNDVGNMCRSEQHIIEFGFHQYIAKGSKHNKEAEKKKSLMTMLRQIAKLFLDFKDTYKHRTKKDCISITEMFIRDNFEYLKEVLQCRKDSANDLNLSLGYAMKKFAKFLHDKYTTVGKDEQANEHMKFHHILTHNWPILFGEMEYQAVIARTNTRKPKELPEEEDVKILMNYMQNQITELTSDRYKFTSSDEFATLRNVLLCRVTLFNARRGGEPSRLTLQQWAEAENGDWVGNFEDSGLLDEDREILKTMKVAYQTGKRDDSLVPVLFPDDTITGLRMIADPEIRKDGGVNKYNKFLFPSTNLSDKHVNGSDSIRAVCTKAGVNTITATKFRHRVSTKYAQIETNKQHRDAFFRHMGHSDSINRNVYQCPPAVIEVTKVGRFLQNIDSGMWKQVFYFF
jgi:integrase